MLNKSNLFLTMSEISGKQVLSYDGIPFRRTDALVNTELPLPL